MAGEGAYVREDQWGSVHRAVRQMLVHRTPWRLKWVACRVEMTAGHGRWGGEMLVLVQQYIWQPLTKQTRLLRACPLASSRIRCEQHPHSTSLLQRLAAPAGPISSCVLDRQTDSTVTVLASAAFGIALGRCTRGCCGESSSATRSSLCRSPCPVAQKVVAQQMQQRNACSKVHGVQYLRLRYTRYTANGQRPIPSMRRTTIADCGD